MKFDCSTPVFTNNISQQLCTRKRECEVKNRPTLTRGSLLTDASFPIGDFCFDKLPAFAGGGVARRGREESIANQPFVRPSSPPKIQSYKLIHCQYVKGKKHFLSTLD